MAEEVESNQLKTLQEILKDAKKQGLSLKSGFSTLQNTMQRSIKVQIDSSKILVNTILGLKKATLGMNQEFKNGMQDLEDAQKRQLEFEKSEAEKKKLADAEGKREKGKGGAKLELPKFKELLDPKAWKKMAASFVGVLFAMLKGLVTSILLPLAVGAMKGYYGTIAKFFKLAFTGFGKLLNFGVKAITFIGKLLGDFSKNKLLPAALQGAKVALTAIGDLVGKGFSGLLKFLKGTKLGMGFLLVIEDIKSIGSAISGGVGKLLTSVKGIFTKGIFDPATKFFDGLPKSFAESSVGRFFAKVKGIFTRPIWGSFDEAGAIPKTFADTKIGQFVAKVKGFFNKPFFVKAGEMFKVSFKFAETGIGKLITKIQGFLGIGADAAKAGAKSMGMSVLDDVKDMGKAIAESPIGKFFGKIKTFFGFGKEKSPVGKVFDSLKSVLSFELPEGMSKILGGIGKVFGKVFAVFGIFMGIYEAVKAFTTTEGTFGEKVVAALKAFIDEVVFGLPNFLIEMVGKGVSGLLKFLGFGDSAKAVEDATKDFSIMDLISDSVGKVWEWMKGFFSDLFSFDGLSFDNILPKFDFDIGNPLKMIGEKLGGIFGGLADFAYKKLLVPDWFGDLFTDVADKVKGWGSDGEGDGAQKKTKMRSGGMIPQRVTGDQVPAILHANEVVLAENSARLFLQAAQMFARPEYANAIKDLVKTNSQLQSETTDAIMTAGAMTGGGDQATAQMMSALMNQQAEISNVLAQLPSAVQAGANQGTYSGARVMTGPRGTTHNPHEMKPKH